MYYKKLYDVICLLESNYYTVKGLIFLLTKQSTKST